MTWFLYGLVIWMWSFGAVMVGDFLVRKAGKVAQNAADENGYDEEYAKFLTTMALVVVCAFWPAVYPIVWWRSKQIRKT